MNQFSPQFAIISKLKKIVTKTSTMLKGDKTAGITEAIARKIQKGAYEAEFRKDKESKTPPYLTIAEQQLFVDFLKKHPQYNHWYPVFAVMLGTGMRVGEIVGLRWCDIDLEKGIISVNHTLVYYNHGDGKGCSFSLSLLRK